MPDAMERYLFDLNGYLVLRNAIDPEHLRALNEGIDALLPLEIGEWNGYVHGHNYGDDDGFNLQQIYEGGEPFERLIDHPAWIEHVKHFVGGEGTFDWHHGPLFIDENFATLRGPGEAIGLHSGGHLAVKRNQYRYYNGFFRCGQINILLALTNIGPGDGSTMVIPGSHKANLEHPEAERRQMRGEEASVDGVTGAIEVHLAAGDALLFVDAIMHGSARRSSAGIRRTIVYRYGPSWGNFRHGYQPSPDLLARLTPQRRQIVQPQQLIPRAPQKQT
ncbi:MAG: phytanoyl-CoA dioxygenase family protein [Anaerolineaceae bacterium]|nr:phytanoyl-CoA dioxygenase family protein [Anaerolineaceae bacterium]